MKVSCYLCILSQSLLFFVVAGSIKEKVKEIYLFQIALMPEHDPWEKDGEKIYLPIMKYPPKRPRKNRIKPSDDSKRRHKCLRCGGYGHCEKTCRNLAPQNFDPNEIATYKRLLKFQFLLFYFIKR